MNLITDDRIPIADLFEKLESVGLCVRDRGTGDPVLTSIDLPHEDNVVDLRRSQSHGGAMPPGGDVA